ncbi:MAG: pilus assembly protein PilZ [Endozoicomonadaceae bacterium]|nr:pilus assembly protein PilZ [Endozoicomonadaceae bacterium]
MDNTSNTKKVIIDIHFATKDLLYRAYMPFLINGGLCITSKHPYDMDDTIFIRLKLLDEPAILPIVCKVVWLTPVQNFEYGIGLQFIEDDEPAKNKIENLLAGLLNSDRPTATL